MNRFILFLASILLFGIVAANAQTKPVHPSEIITGKYLGLTKPLRDLPKLTASEFKAIELKAKTRQLNEGLRLRYYPYASTALPKGADPAWQKSMGSVKSVSGTIQNFGGQDSPYYPPDCNGVAGRNHFMQVINCVYSVYTKTGTLVAGPTAMNLLFGGVPGSNNNDGDPVILYDEQADRYLASEISISGSINYILMAVSATNDPTGSWHTYSFQVATMPDYAKISVWRDGYYMGDNNSSGNDIYVFERSKMLTGATAQAVGFNNSWRPGSVDGFMSVPPVDNDGAGAPTGTPGMYIAFNDDAFGGGADQLWLYELSVDWTTPSNSTFNRTQQLDVLPFSANFGPNWNNIPQKGTGQKVDGIPQVIMNVPQYRNFGSYQTIVCCHTVNVDGLGHAGIRWYELRRNGTSPWVIRQQGTYAPDDNCRWMGCIMINGHNKIGLGYSISSTNLNPGIRFCGQSPAAYNNASGIMDLAEDTIMNGNYSQTGINRWGDYSLLSIDPTDDETFWFTSEYIGNGGSRKTQIASFKFVTGPMVTTQSATAITSSAATLNGTINPQGFETDYHFEYGTIPFNLANSTPTISAGAGDTTLTVNADISGLLNNKKYYFRLVGSNPAGIMAGSVLNFTTANAPILTVTPHNQNVPTPADSTFFTVNSNVTWTATSGAAWCMVSSAPQSGNGTITARYEENTSVNQRIASITVSSDSLSPQVVTVTQEGVAPILMVTPPNRNVTSSFGNTDFTVTSNIDWTVAADSSWCTVTPSGSGDGTITANFTDNPTTSQRIAHIYVSGSGVAVQTVTVTQAGAAPTLSVTPPNQNVTATQASTSFTVTSNSEWTVTTDSPWCTVTSSGQGNGTIVADYTGNSTGSARIATISVMVASLPVQQVTVTQAKTALGTEDLSGNGWQIIPNPSHGIFRVIPSGITNTLEITIEDMTGLTIYKQQFSGQKEYLFDLSNLPEGCYPVILKTESSRIVRKLVIIK